MMMRMRPVSYLICFSRRKECGIGIDLEEKGNGECVQATTSEMAKAEVPQELSSDIQLLASSIASLSRFPEVAQS